MIVTCGPADRDTIAAIVNDAATAYRGVIPAECYHQPYMPRDELDAEIAAGVFFLGYATERGLQAVMGYQERGDVTLIRHAYTRTTMRGRGYGSALIREIQATAIGPLLVGTWAAAGWAVDFYRAHGFELVGEASKNALLARYWTVPPRQVANSVVLADRRGMALAARD